MTRQADRQIADSIPKSWVERAPEALRPYLRLARYDRPIGFWLLALPCWMGLLLGRAGQGLGLQELYFAVLFAIGAVAMRGAGCTYNDIVDRDLDAQVARTADRPLAAGTIGLKAAWGFLVAQCLIGLIVLIQLPLPAIITALFSLVLVAAYPFMKRITWWPQAWLGLTFNWGVPVAYVTAAGAPDTANIWPMLALYAGCIAWTIGYDTIYAHQDEEDDAMIGVRSTARLFGSASRFWIAGFYVAAALLTALSGVLAGLTPWFAAGFLLYAGHLFNQIRKLDTGDGAACLALFKSNRTTGLLLCIALAIGALF